MAGAIPAIFIVASARFSTVISRVVNREFLCYSYEFGDGKSLRKYRFYQGERHG